MKYNTTLFKRTRVCDTEFSLAKITEIVHRYGDIYVMHETQQTELAIESFYFSYEKDKQTCPLTPVKIHELYYTVKNLKQPKNRYICCL